jgi:hypothetical protein
LVNLWLCRLKETLIVVSFFLLLFLLPALSLYISFNFAYMAWPIAIQYPSCTLFISFSSFLVSFLFLYEPDVFPFVTLRCSSFRSHRSFFTTVLSFLWRTGIKLWLFYTIFMTAVSLGMEHNIFWLFSFSLASIAFLSGWRLLDFAVLLLVSTFELIYLFRCTSLL